MKIHHVLFLAVCALLCGCAIEHDVVKNPSPLADLAAQTDDSYRIGAGDELELKFFFVPDMNDVVQVRPDGNISVMFANDIRAAGRTPKELAAAIRKRLKPFVKQPDVMVSVNEFGSQKVYVGGEVMKPGPVTLSKRSTLTQVLGEAGWLTPLASTHEIVIIHKEGGKEKIYHINPGKILSGEDTDEDVMITAGDVVLVPPSASVSMDRWIDQNIRLVLPFSMSAGYIYSNTSNASLFR